MADAKPYSGEELRYRRRRTEGLEYWDRIFATIDARDKRIEELERGIENWQFDYEAEHKRVGQQAAEIERLKGIIGDCIAIMEQFDPNMDAPRLLEYNADLSGQILIARQAFERSE